MVQTKKTTIAYCGAFAALGLAVSALGPALPKLAEQVGVELDAISILFTARSAGFLAGAILAGRLYDRFSGHHLIALSLLMVALTITAVPFMPALGILVALFLLMGLFQPGIDVGGNTMLLWLYREKVGPVMTGVHFFFGVGALLSPLIIRWSFTNNSGLSIAFLLIGILIFLPALLLVWLPSPTMPQQSPQEAAAPVNWLFVGLIASFFFLYTGIEISFGGWLLSYATAVQLATEEAAATLTSLFWAALTAGRLLSLPLIRRYQTRTIIFMDLLGCLLSLGLIILGNSATTLWAGTIALGISMASLFPMMLALAEQNLRISGKTTSYFFMGGSVGGMIIPWTIGQLFEPFGPHSVMLVIFICVAIATAVFSVLVWKINSSRATVRQHTAS